MPADLSIYGVPSPTPFPLTFFMWHVFLVFQIGDFGEARKQVEEGLTSLNTLGSRQQVGTIPFMSPEACSCEPLDKANGIYAFSLVMYELCFTKC